MSVCLCVLVALYRAIRAIQLRFGHGFDSRDANLVAQRSATPASVAATPACSATPSQRQLDVRHSWPFKGDRCDRAF